VATTPTTIADGRAGGNFFRVFWGPRADQAAHHERAAAQDDIVASQDRQQQQDRATEDFYRRFPGLTRDANERDRERDDFDRGRERER
jgi:hypothetical protein